MGNLYGQSLRIRLGCRAALFHRGAHDTGQSRTGIHQTVVGHRDRAPAHDDRQHIYIYDKFHRRYVAESLQTLYDILPVAVTPLDLQNVLLGQPFIFGETALQPSDYKKFDIISGENGDWALQPQKQYRDFTYRFLLNGNNLLGMQAYQNNTLRQISSTYADHRKADGKVLPSSVQITAQGGSRKYTLNINYDPSSAVWDNNIGIEKLPTTGYTVMTFSQLLKSLIP